MEGKRLGALGSQRELLVFDGLAKTFGEEYSLFGIAIARAAYACAMRARITQSAKASAVAKMRCALALIAARQAADEARHAF